MPETYIAKKSPSQGIKNICACACHDPKKIIIHFIPCCEGKCTNCREFIKQGLINHQKHCKKKK
jgi:hypothetical protein